MRSYEKSDGTLFTDQNSKLGHFLPGGTTRSPGPEGRRQGSDPSDRVAASAEGKGCLSPRTARTNGTGAGSPGLRPRGKRPLVQNCTNPDSRRERKGRSPRPMMTWSRTSMSRILPASTSWRVMRMSSAEGVTSPEGWLCYVKRILMCSERTASLKDHVFDGIWREERCHERSSRFT